MEGKIQIIRAFKFNKYHMESNRVEVHKNGSFTSKYDRLRATYLVDRFRDFCTMNPVVPLSRCIYRYPYYDFHLSIMFSDTARSTLEFNKLGRVNNLIPISKLR